ncbi:RHS repeat-associated core domain protein containing protein [Polaromonas sp. CF318]|uniref:RHS repeat domain-containing protein n=1 Tax=Polaromonas sp. CF318 TaxID=1144318 RepID=UPI00027135C8|nr:RHS repeat-associated core domain-containing protein [Polaromonas sp. CF318]EJL79761.1 RHS repeat-associated core domain protein containing protein [Polaromonas sp. CF318]
MKQQSTKRVAALWLLALLGPWGSQARADTQIRTGSFEYDARGLLIREVVEPDRPNDCLQTSHSYDTFGNKSSITTAACAGATGYAIASAATPRTASNSYGADGRFPLSTNNVLGQSETKTYDARFGATSRLTGPNSLATQWEYDGFGRKAKETRSDGTYTTWAYKLCTDAGISCPGPIGGAVIKWVAIEQSYAGNAAVNAPEKRSYYDTLNRVVRSQTAGFDGAGAAPILAQDTEYDALGRVSRKSNLYKLTGGTAHWATYTYDVLGRVTKEESPDPDATGGVAVTTISYNGLTTVTTNSKGQTKTTTKNAQGQVAQVTDTQGNTVTYTYDALGQLRQTNAAGSITTMAYNQRGQKTSMADTAMGAWEYRYNVFGELVWQRDSLGQSVTMVYDSLGRMTQRTEPDLVSQWSYDTKFDGSACGKGVGKLCEAKADNGYKRVHTYDSLGRASSTSTVLDNPATPAVVSIAYDAVTGRMASKTWPTGYRASYVYSATGYLKQVNGGGTNGFTQTVSYEVLAMDAQGHITQYKQGNQVTTVKAYNEANGRLTGQTVTKDGQATGNVLNQSYTYDSLGNLKTRADNSSGVGTQESFSYDSLNRLTLNTLLSGAVSPPTTTEVMYDARGNITYKSDVGRYWYDGARPNRMTNITLETAPGAQVALSGTRQLTYAFDDYKPGAQTVNSMALGNGNLWYTVSQDAVNNRRTVRWESYTSFNMPARIEFGALANATNPTATATDRSLTFVYGPEHQRIKQTVTGGPNPGTTWYLNGEDSLGLSYEKEIKATGITENKHYVSAGGVVFALFVQRTGALGSTPATATSYFHHDHLGSVTAISNETGAVIERMAFDPWGKRRFVNGKSDTLDAIAGINTDRGYTLHEHLDEMGVIHMNGRVYDPLIGRFMSADPFIQDPAFAQSYNRYAYVMNNPLAYTDPSGYFSLRSVFKVVVTVVVAYYTGGAISGAFASASGGAATALGSWAVTGTGATFQLSAIGSALAGAAGGFAAGAVSSGGTFKGAMQGALSGGLFGAAGGIGQAASAERYLAHAAAGCIGQAASGGNCGAGAASAVFGKFATNTTESWGSGVAQGTAVAIAGGVGSEIAGGKFRNGAATAAFGYLFNNLMHITGGMRERTNPFGHSALAVEGAGMFSYGNNTLLGSDPLAYISKQSELRDQQITIIPTTAEQDAAALSYFAGKPGKNSVGIIDNCVVRTNEALGAAGISNNAAAFPGSLARETMKIPGAETYYIPKGGQIPQALIDTIKQRFAPPNGL